MPHFHDSHACVGESKKALINYLNWLSDKTLPDNYPKTYSVVLKDPCFIFPMVRQKLKVTAHMNTYD